MPLEVIILAAGEGTRMGAARPKALHTVGGRPMLAHVLATAHALDPAAIHVVTGHRGAQVRAATEKWLAAPRAGGDLPGAEAVRWVEQQQRRGTGHAVLQAMPQVAPGAWVLVLYGDVPLLRPATLSPFIAPAGGALALLTVTPPDPSGLGRILRDEGGRVVGIVEERDAGRHRAVRECNAGVMAGPAEVMTAQLAQLQPHNAQGELYLTDIIGHASAAGIPIADHAASAEEVCGVNTHAELARAERIYQRRQADALLDHGVAVRDPARLEVRGHWRFGRDCTVDVGVILEGDGVVGDGCTLGAYSVLRDCTLGTGAVIEPHCVIEGAIIGEQCRIGPFARLRPRTTLADEVRIGNFVEVKASRIGAGSKAGHLAYLGDSTVGEGVNIGAGVITCNYDGAAKHATVIGDGVFVGADSQLVAPLTVGAAATVAAGSTITRDVAPGVLAVTRAEQRAVRGWRRPRRRDSTAEEPCAES